MSKRRRHKTTPTAAPVRGNAPMPYFSLARHPEEQSADIYIFGNIAHNRGGLSGLLQANSDQSSYDLANQIAGIPEDWAITVHINSNGGELKEGLGIYNVLKSRSVTTICEGFAASAGSVIFCAGKTRIMQPASLLFIHQAQMEAEGNADDFQKAADDLRIVTSAAVEAYKEAGITIDDDQLDAMLKAETWITPEEAVAFGFATQIAEPDEDDDDPDDVIVNDAMRSIMAAVKRPAAPKILDESGDETGFKVFEYTDLVAVPEETLAVLQTFTETAAEYSDLFEMASTVLAAINNDPELLPKLKAAASLLLATTPTPKTPASVGNKGFFGFAD